MATLFTVGKAEEESVLIGASVVNNGKFHAITPAPDELIGDGFKSLIHSSNCCAKVEFTVDLKQSKKLVSSFILNRPSNDARIG